MRKRQIKIQKLLFGIIIVALMLPLLQITFQIFDIDKLRGNVTYASKPEFSSQSWFDADYQDGMDAYIKDNIGFHTFFVKIYSQLNFSLFNSTTAYDVVIGKQNVLYEGQYIRSFLGRDFIGQSAIKQKVHILEKVKDTLSKLGVELIPIFAPSKAVVYPEFIPDSCFEIRNDSTNYQVLAEEIRKSNISTLDLMKWFPEIKETSQYPLYASTGSHWSCYADYLVVDTLVSYINALKGEQVMEVALDSSFYSIKPLQRDNDIGDILNVFTEINQESLAYPKFQVIPASASPQRKLIAVSDSYFTRMFDEQILHPAFKNLEYWYYFYSIRSNNEKDKQDALDYDLKTAIESADYILLLSTDSNLPTYGFDFLERVYGIYFPEEKLPLFESKISILIERMWKNKTWFDQVKAAAIRDSISLEESLRGNAIWVIEQEYGPIQ